MSYLGFSKLSLAYEDKLVLRDVSLSMERGEWLSLVGRNGTGKSSLLKVLGRSLKPVSGHAYYEGRPLVAYAPRFLAQRMAILPQLRRTPQGISVHTLVSMGCYPKGGHRSALSEQDKALVRKQLERTGLQNKAHAKLSQISGGELQRAFLALCLCQEPEILVLDEPTSHLDLCYQLEILSLIKELHRSEGLTVLMVLHDINLAARFSDRIAVLKDQRLACQGSPETLLNPAFMQRYFQVEASLVNDPVDAQLHVLTHAPSQKAPGAP